MYDKLYVIENNGYIFPVQALGRGAKHTTTSPSSSQHLHKE